MEAKFYNTVNSLKEANSQPGSLLLIGFNEDLSYTILNAMKDGKLLKRNITIVDTFNSVAWQKAFDFCNEVRNKIKHHGEYIKSDPIDVKHLTPTFTIISSELNEALPAYSTLFESLGDDNTIHFRDIKIKADNDIVNAKLKGKYIKSKVSTTPTGELTVVKAVSQVAKVKVPVRTKSDLT